MKYNLNKYLKYLKILLFLISLIMILLFIYSYTKLNYNNNIIYKDKIIYIDDFLNNTEYEKLLINLENDNRNLIDENFRLILPLDHNNNKIIYDTFYSEKYINLLQLKTNNYNIFKSDFPIEYRIYPKNSKGMNLHSDTLLYDLPQNEAIYTIHNTSDSQTKWFDENNKENSIWTKPNSMLIVKADALKHMVTPITTGTRSILKLIYTQSDNINNNYKMELNRFNNL